jgi:hypothetical protein
MTSHRTPKLAIRAWSFTIALRISRRLHGTINLKFFLAIRCARRNNETFFENGGSLPASHRSQMQGTP